MVVINLEGDTLGRRHKHYNKLLKQALTSEPSLEEINQTDNDINNLFRIDIACRKKDVEYVMEVLRSDDLLYVSRAIKRSSWLIKDPAYANIINPEHLHNVVFPHMTSKAINKFLLNIRLNLKDESRAEIFYKYYKDKNMEIAIKWLSLCSVALIEKEVESLDDIDICIFKRLCERSFKVFEICVSKLDYNQYAYIRSAMFLLNTKPENFLDIIEKLESYQVPRLGSKFTAVIMNKCPERILNKFEKYYDKVDLEIFAKYFKKGDAKAFILKQLANKAMDSNWFRFENIKYFVRYIPKDGRFEFLKKVFIEKTQTSADDNIAADLIPCSVSMSRCYSPKRKVCATSANIYRWYRFAPFDIAFTDLKKLIRTESNPSERTAMLKVLISSAARNMQNIHTVLQYYHDKHINEPLNYKMQFVNNILSDTNTHVFDDKTWQLLNNIFCSMGVYTESDSYNVQNCIEAIIVYKILHYEKVPDIIEKKFTYDTLKSYRKKLNKAEQDKIFEYLYNTIVLKLHNKTIQNNVDFEEAIDLLEKALGLLVDWDRQLTEYPLLINRIKSFIKLKTLKSWKADLSCLYDKRKQWKKHLFEDSIVLLLNEEVCMNTLKHDSDMLSRYFDIVKSLCLDDRVSLQKLLSKIRVYWSESLCKNWVAAYLKWFSEPRPTGHAALVRGLCTLLPRHQLLDLARQHVPTETKITYTEEENSNLSVSKQFAMNLHLVRPIPSPDFVLLFAQGDYLQYTMPSLNSVLYNISSVSSKEFIPKILNAPVSLQKHGIRLAFIKLESKELKEIFSQTWKTTKNSSIRAVLFKQTIALMCREKKTSTIEEVFVLISDFIKNLSAEEDKIIYTSLGEVDKVPQCVKAKFFMKSYKYLKSLPAKANCEDILKRMLNYSTKIMEDLNSDFVAEVLLECNIKSKIKDCDLSILSAHLLCARDVRSQTQKFEKVMVPWLDYTFSQWNVNLDKSYNARYNLYTLLELICRDIQQYVLKKNMVFPIKLFTDILTKIESNLSIINNYVLFRHMKLAIAYIQLLEEQKSIVGAVRQRNLGNRSGNKGFNNDDWNEVHLKVSRDFAAVCLKVLHDDVQLYFPSVYLLLAKSLTKFLNCFDMDATVKLATLKSIIQSNKMVEGYLFVLEAMPAYLGDDAKNIEKEICEMISTHSSPEIKMHYYDKYGSDQDTNVN